MWSVSAAGIRHRVRGGITYCGKYAWQPFMTKKPDGEDCIRCKSVKKGLYRNSVAVGRNKKLRR
jgi:hypothetical protein